MVVLDVHIPSELKQIPQWVVWVPELNPRGKMDKIPYCAQGGGRASSTDPATWVDFQTAWNTYQRDSQRWGGVGFVLADDDGLVGIDLDDCLTGESQLSDFAAAVVKQIGSYTEISPSGNGVKIICRGNIPRSFIDSERQIEIYRGKRFFTITGHRFGDVENVVGAQTALDEIVSTFKQRSAVSEEHEGYTARRVSTELIVNKANAAINSDRFKALWSGDWVGMYGSQSEADAALMSMLAFWAGPDREWLIELFRESGLYREKFERADYQAGLLALALDGLDDWYDWFPLTSNANGRAGGGGSISLEDFYAYMPKHDYIFIPTRDHWPLASVNARLPKVSVGIDDDGEPIMMKPSSWLDNNRPVEQITWAPGEPTLIHNKLMSHAGWVNHMGKRTFNQYRASALGSKEGDPTPWLDHVKRVYPDDWRHLVLWMAQRVQSPGVKINHALVLGGSQGIGKDTILEPLKHCVGPWNFSEISPSNVLGQFNGFAKSVVLRISEARDLGESDRYKFYEHMKVYTASPPDALRVNEKFTNEHYIPNVTGVIITTNHMEGGLYLPDEDRRHYFAWSKARMSDFDETYWLRLWRWYARGGFAVVNGYLRRIDLSAFDPKAPPSKTSAFWDAVASASAPEDAELIDILDKLGWPEFVTVSDLVSRADWSMESYLTDRRNARKIPHRLREVGYVRVRNPDAKSGVWVVHGKRQVVYARMEMSESERLTVVRKSVSRY